MSNSSNRFRNRSKKIGQLKQEVEEVDVDDNDLLPYSVKVKDQEVLLELADARKFWINNRHRWGFDGMPFELTTMFNNIIKKQYSLSANDAVDKEAWQKIDYMTANADDPDVAKTKLVKTLFKFVDNEPGKDVTQLHVSGVQGAGKTNFSFLLAELWKFQGDGRKILTNTQGVSNTVHIAGRDELEDWLDDNQGTEFIFVFDEFNKHASGSDHHEVINQLFELITFLRKKKGNYIIIGHTGKDIHPWIRELCTFVHKTSKKTAKVYEGLDESGEPENHIKTYRKVPKCSYDIDTFDESTWSWGEEQTKRCVGTNKDGERCMATVRADWGDDISALCDSHNHQDEPHPSVPNEDLLNTKFEEEYVDGIDEVYESTDGDEDDTPDESESRQRSDSNEADGDDTPTEKSESSESNLIDEVPEKYWSIVEDRTAGSYGSHNVDDIQLFEQLLNEKQWSRLQKELNI